MGFFLILSDTGVQKHSLGKNRNPTNGSQRAAVPEIGFLEFGLEVVRDFETRTRRETDDKPPTQERRLVFAGDVCYDSIDNRQNPFDGVVAVRRRPCV